MRGQAQRLRRKARQASTRRRSQPRPWYDVRPRFLTGALLGLGVGLVTIALFCTWSGRAFLADVGLAPRFLPRLADHLDVAVSERFLDLGLLKGDLRARQLSARGRPVREYTFHAPPHLTPTLCNLWITRAARAAHARVVRADEDPKRGGVVVLHLGFGSRITHRIVVQPPLRVAAVERSPRIALVIDDLGQNMNATTRGMFGLGVPITVAVLPDLPDSRDAFAAAEKYGVPALLHLPMEPEGNENPGRDPVRVGMSPAAVDAILERHQRRYPNCIGLNNHMGSRATADAPTMRALAAALGQRDWLFLDSMTTPHSVGYPISRQLGVWSVRNDMFLDDKARTAAAVAENVRQLAALARSRGWAVGIAHPRPYTLQALRAQLPRLCSEGIIFVTLPQLRDGRRPEPAAARPAGPGPLAGARTPGGA